MGNHLLSINHDNLLVNRFGCNFNVSREEIDSIWQQAMNLQEEAKNEYLAARIGNYDENNPAYMEPTIRARIMKVVDLIVKTVDCKRIYLFGSYVYGSPHESSDFDFYVVLNDKAGDINICRRNIMAARFKAKDVREIIDIHIDHESSFRKNSQEFSSFEKSVAKDGVIIYESS